jgi:hypothetical protein
MQFNITKGNIHYQNKIMIICGRIIERKHLSMPLAKSVLLSAWFHAQLLAMCYMLVDVGLKLLKIFPSSWNQGTRKLPVAAELYSEPISFSSYLHDLFPNFILSFVLGMGVQKDILLCGPLRNMLQIFPTLNVACPGHFNFQNLTTITI